MAVTDVALPGVVAAKFTVYGKNGTQPETAQAKATVTIFDPITKKYVDTQTTDANGNCTLIALPGEYILTVSAVGFADVTLSVVKLVDVGNKNGKGILYPNAVTISRVPTKIGFQLRGSEDDALVGVSVSMTNVDGVVLQTLTTDAAGLVQFDFPSLNYRDGDPVRILASGFGGLYVDPTAQDDEFIVFKTSAITTV